MITLKLTPEETEVLLNLMQAGARSFVGPQFDSAALSYLHLREKITAARARPALEAVEAA